MRKIILFILCIIISLAANATFKGLKLWNTDYELPLFYFLPADNHTVMEALLYFKVKNPEIVLAQAILETGHFKSNNCINKNNLFGLTKYYGKYHKFSSWIESIQFYINVVEIRYKPPNETYYQFLKRIKYAHDKKYIYKLKQIVKCQKTNYLNKL